MIYTEEELEKKILIHRPAAIDSWFYYVLNGKLMTFDIAGVPFLNSAPIKNYGFILDKKNKDLVIYKTDIISVAAAQLYIRNFLEDKKVFI